MKIVVLEGSPNKKGSTHLLADCFRQGAEEAGISLNRSTWFMPISIPVQDVSTAVMKDPVRRRMMWKVSGGKF